MKLTELKSTASNWDVWFPDPREGYLAPKTLLKKGEHMFDADGEDYEFVSATHDGKKIVSLNNGKMVQHPPAHFDATIVPKGTKPKNIKEATSATTSTSKTYKLKKYAGAGLGMWIKDAEADGFKVKKLSGDADKDNDVWNAFDGNRKVGSFSDEERSGWLQAKL